MTSLTQAQFDRLFPRADDAWLVHLNRAVREFAINTPARMAHFLAQIGHESGGLTVLEENLRHSARSLARTWPNRFRNAAGNPNEDAVELARRSQHEIGDAVYARVGGYRFRGRGLIQITGQNNYRAAGRALGVDLGNDPDLAAHPEHAARIAAWFWDQRGLNALADRDDMIAITRRINGGLNGLADRRAWLVRAKAIMAERDPDEDAATADRSPQRATGPIVAGAAGSGGILAAMADYLPYLRDVGAFIRENPQLVILVLGGALLATAGIWAWRRWQSWKREAAR